MRGFASLPYIVVIIGRTFFFTCFYFIEKSGVLVAAAYDGVSPCSDIVGTSPRTTTTRRRRGLLKDGTVVSDHEEYSAFQLVWTLRSEDGVYQNISVSVSLVHYDQGGSPWTTEVIQYLVSNNKQVQYTVVFH